MPVSRSFASTSFALSATPVKKSVSKIWNSAEEAVADVKGDSILLSGGQSRLPRPAAHGSRALSGVLEGGGHLGSAPGPAVRLCRL